MIIVNGDLQNLMEKFRKVCNVKFIWEYGDVTPERFVLDFTPNPLGILRGEKLEFPPQTLEQHINGNLAISYSWEIDQERPVKKLVIPGDQELRFPTIVKVLTGIIDTYLQKPDLRTRKPST